MMYFLAFIGSPGSSSFKSKVAAASCFLWASTEPMLSSNFSFVHDSSSDKKNEA